MAVPDVGVADIAVADEAREVVGGDKIVELCIRDEAVDTIDIDEVVLEILRLFRFPKGLAGGLGTR